VRVNRGVGLLVYLFLAASLSVAQSPNGTVSGIVLDPSGGVIVGASVLVINSATGVEYPGNANSEGYYVVPNIPPGNYRIQVSNSGFKTIIKPDIVIHVEDALAINFTLPIGAASEIVTVEGGAPLINTENASVSTIVDRQFAENLPLNGRSFQTLIQLTPGVVLTASTASDSGQFSVNGQRADANYWMVDGVSANFGVGANPNATGPGNGLAGSLGSFNVGGGTNSLVSVDAMEEFRIQTSTYAPEFGRTPGGQISIVTRSGKNQFHGAAFDYLRNDVFDASDWFANANRLPKPEERQNDFGGTFSGPIIKDKTFFFFSYEGLRLRLPETTLTDVPCDSSCLIFGNARTTAVPAMQRYLNAYPLPNGPEVFTPCTPNVDGCAASGQQSTGTAQFNESYSNKSSLDAYSLRIDHRLTKGWRIFGRYNYSPSESDARGASGTASLSTVNPIHITTQTGTAGGTWSFAPEAVNDLRFNYSRADAFSSYHLDSFGGAIPLASVPFPSGFTPANAEFQFDIFPQSFYIGSGVHQLQRQSNLVDSLSLQRGRHSLKIGVDFRVLLPVYDPPQYTQTPFFFGMSSAQSGTALFAKIESTRNATFLFRNLGLYVQDTWKVARRLTVTYGLRWDVDFAPSSIEGPSFPAASGFNLNDLSNLTLAPPGTPPFKTPYRNLAPRIGVAYQISERPRYQTVVRGGLGVFYDLLTSEVGNGIFASAYPFGNVNHVFEVPFPLDAASAAPPAITFPGAAGYLAAYDPTLKLPYTLEWNVAVEQALGKEQTITASYVGSSGRRLIQTVQDQGQPTPSISIANLVVNGGSSNYQALQIQFQRRLSNGLQVLSSYIWSHSIDTGSAGSVGGNAGANALVPSAIANANRGPSDFDIRNAFSAGLTYDVPAPKVNAFVNAILHGWSLQSVVQARTAPPVNINYSSFGQLSDGFVTSVRPNAVPGQPFYLYGRQYPGGKALNPEAFAGPPTDPVSGLPVGQGDLPRNALRGFGATQWDFAVHRNFPIHESVKLQFRAEMFNVLNHPNFGPPNGDLGSPQSINPQFGLSRQMLGQSLGSANTGGGGFNPLYQIGGPRSIQLALKLLF
jgi:hypothetical protein